jgi:hypothetical protein
MMKPPSTEIDRPVTLSAAELRSQKNRIGDLSCGQPVRLERSASSRDCRTLSISDHLVEDGCLNVYGARVNQVDSLSFGTRYYRE